MTLDILVNGQRVDVLDRSSLNLRLNNVIYNPTEINNTQAEYSFSFNLPTTPNNNKIFDYANVLAKVNKFQNVYSCEVYSDEVLIFKGSLRIQSIKKGFYNVNLVNIKINTVDEIFGDMKLNEVDWKIPFTGIGSINTHNANANSKVIFPLVSYGVFQKKPASTQYDYNQYTSKFQIDKYNKWYYESFNPSPNLIELVKRLFEQKGYKVSGNIFQDKALNNIYMSTNLSNDQIPTYNLGYPNLGQATITTTFSNYVNKNTGQSNSAECLEHNLGYPYEHTVSRLEDSWSFDSVDIYDLWSNTNSKIERESEHYLFDEFSNCIVIPSDGLYKVQINANISIPPQTLKGAEYWVPDRGRDPEEHEITLNNSLKDDMPIEIQLVKNENECELIHGPLQWRFISGDRAQKTTWNTAYPHEALQSAINPTVSNANFSSGYSNRSGAGQRSGGRVYSTVGSSRRPSSGGGSQRPGSGTTLRGYMPQGSQILAYDPWVNNNFIAGLTTLGNGNPSFIKNGYSWNPACSDQNDSRYVCNGYYRLTSTGRTNVTYTWTETEFNKNELLDSPANSITYTNDRTFSGSVSGIVKLKRNDVIMLKALARHWHNLTREVYYNFDCTVTVTIEAYSPFSIGTIETQNRGWTSPSQFDVDLQIGNFLNKETKASDFIHNFLKEFNLQYVNEGNAVYLNTQRFDINKAKYAINLDNRVDEGESQVIEYPSYLVTKYKIDTEEWGFETTVPADKINDPNWKDYGDYGYDKVVINDRSKESGEEVQLTTSYCWYDEFKVLNDSDEELGIIKIPVISKYSYMIDGYSYEDSMKVDGKGLPMRYWYRGKDTGFDVMVNGKYPVNIYNTLNTYNGLDLSYHNTDRTLLTKYFNLNPDLSSNYVSIKCYLTASEYSLLKGGANVIFDSDVYIVSEIQGYDANGINQTELLLIKKK